jgi:transposase
MRAHFVGGDTVAAAAATHGYSRGGFYLVADAFAELGMGGLLDERRGRKGPVKLTDEVVAFLQAAPRETSAPALTAEVAARFGISLHRRTIERVRRR